MNTEQKAGNLGMCTSTLPERSMNDYTTYILIILFCLHLIYLRCKYNTSFLLRITIKGYLKLNNKIHNVCLIIINSISIELSAKGAKATQTKRHGKPKNNTTNRVHKKQKTKKEKNE